MRVIELDVCQLAQYTVLYVGYSGGLDSTVLLHRLTSESCLLPKIHAVHIHHGLSHHADAWEAHCQQSCITLKVKFSAYRVQLPSQTNLEEQARDARCSVFESLLTASDGLLLAHHQDDQAETWLLNLMRGAGMAGLSAMLPVKPLAKGDLLRPLLSYPRSTLEAYAKQHALNWVEDESNQDTQFSRNFLRHRVMPLLQSRWPAAVKTITRAAKYCQQAKENLDALAVFDCSDVSTPSNTLSIASLQALPRARLLNVLRVWLKHHIVLSPTEKMLHRIIDEVMFARQDASPQVLFSDVAIRRYQAQLYCCRVHPHVIKAIIPWPHFPAPLPLGESLGTLTASGGCLPLGKNITVRYRRGGEQLRWHGQTKSLKQLMQQWHIPPWLRDTIPLVYLDECLVVVVGYAVSDDLNSQQLFISSS